MRLVVDPIIYKSFSTSKTVVGLGISEPSTVRLTGGDVYWSPNCEGTRQMGHIKYIQHLLSNLDFDSSIIKGVMI